MAAKQHFNGNLKIKGDDQKGAKRKWGTRLCLVFVCFLLVVGALFAFGMGGVAGEEAQTTESPLTDQTAVWDAASATPENTTTHPDVVETRSLNNSSHSDVVVEKKILESEEEVSAIVVFEDTPASTLEADDQVAGMQTHAETTQSEFVAYADSNPGIDVEQQFWILNAVAVSIDPTQTDYQEVGELPNVKGIYKNAQHETQSATTTEPHSQGETPNNASGVKSNSSETEFYDNDYELEVTGTYDLWDDFGTKGTGASVAVLDTGVYENHDDLHVDGWNEWDRYGNPVSSDPHDYNGHGSLSSGLVNGGNSSGTNIGLSPKADHYHGKITSDDVGFTYSAQMIAGVEWAVENDIDIISISFGSEEYRPTYIETFRNAKSAGSTVFVSSGNEGENTSTVPGNEYESIAVGASTESDGIASFSSGEVIDTQDAWGNNAPNDWPDEYVIPDIAAPGSFTWSTTKDGDYDWYSGTSAAAPTAAGAGALLVSVSDGDLSPEEVQSLLEDTAADIGEDEIRQGEGRIDVHEAALQYTRDNFDPEITPQTVNVSESTTLEVDTDLPGDTYTWTFEDGATEVTDEPSVTHTFTELGTTEVTLTIEDTGGETQSTTADIEVGDEIPPEAALDANQTSAVEVGIDTVEFDASESTDNHEISHYNWSLPENESLTDHGPTVEHQFEEIGNQTAAVTVVDEAGNENTTELSVEVVDTTPPVVDVDTPETVFAGVPATFNASNSTDNHQIASYEWEFGENNSQTTADPKANHTYTENGSAEMTLSVADYSGNTNETTETFTVEAVPSVEIIEPTPDVYINESNTSIKYALEQTATDGAAGVEYRVTDADGENVVGWEEKEFENTTSSASFNASTGNLSDGEYIVDFRLLDSEGDPLEFDDSTDSVEFTTKTAPPTVSLAVEPESAEYGMVGNANPANITVSAADPLDGETKLEILDDENTTVETWNLSGSTGDGEVVTERWNATDEAGAPVDPGEYRVNASMVDKIGNANETSVPVTVDTADPHLEVTAIEGVTETDSALYLNQTDTATVELTADDGRTAAEAVQDLEVAVEAHEGNYDKALTPVNESETTWNATIAGEELPHDGTYRLEAKATDSANNTNETTVETPLTLDTVAPELSTVITESDDERSQIQVHTTDPLSSAPAVTVSDPSAQERTVEDISQESERLWEGTVETTEPGQYLFETTGTDHAGNQGLDSATVAIETATATQNETVTFANSETGSFVELETATNVSNASVGLTETDRTPHALPQTAYPLHFLTASVEEDLTEEMLNATVGIPVEAVALPEDVEPTDSDVQFQVYNESTGQWDAQELAVEERTIEDGNQTTAQDFWVASPDTLSSYGITVTDSDGPSFVNTTPDDGDVLDEDTEEVTVIFEYTDRYTDVDPDAVSLVVNGSDVTTDPDTEITATRAKHTVDVNEGAYSATATVGDLAGNEEAYEIGFEVGDDSEDDEEDGGAPAPGFPSPSSDPEPADISLTDVTLESTEIAVGESVDVEANFENTGEESGEVTPELEKDGEVIDSQTLTVEAESTSTETFSPTFDEAGEYELVLEDESAGTLTVVEDGDDTPETDDTDAASEDDDTEENDEHDDQTEETSDEDDVDDTAGDDGLPGFGAVAALLGMLILAVAARRSQT